VTSPKVAQYVRYVLLHENNRVALRSRDIFGFQRGGNCVCEGMGAGAEMGVYELTVVVKGYGC
jgi:hypothetical protein